MLALKKSLPEVKMERCGIERQAQTSTVFRAVPVSKKPGDPIEARQAILEKDKKEAIQ